MNAFKTLYEIAKRKSIIDENNSWSNGSETYFAEIKKEIDEARAEAGSGRTCYLEDELGDILWDYLNILIALEKEHGITTESVLERACKKYKERIAGIESGELWSEIKSRQKVRLAEEQGDQ